MRSLIEKRSLGSRCTALGFAAIILLGNFWLVYRLLGRQTPHFLVFLLEGSALVVILGGFLMSVELIYNIWKKNDHQD